MSLTKTHPKPPQIKWDISDKDKNLIRRIVDRAINGNPNISGTSLDSIMDLTACHANGCPLRLEEILQADFLNFSHDFFGIRRHLDRDTGKLKGHFLPRFAAKIPKGKKK